MSFGDLIQYYPRRGSQYAVMMCYQPIPRDWIEYRAHPLQWISEENLFKSKFGQISPVHPFDQSGLRADLYSFQRPFAGPPTKDGMFPYLPCEDPNNQEERMRSWIMREGWGDRFRHMEKVLVHTNRHNLVTVPYMKYLQTEYLVWLCKFTFGLAMDSIRDWDSPKVPHSYHNWLEVTIQSSTPARPISDPIVLDILHGRSSGAMK